LSGEYGEGKGRGGSRCVRRPRSKSPGDQIEGVVPSDALPAGAAQRRPALHASVSLVSAVARALLSSSTSALQGTCSHREGVETLLSADTLKRSRAQSAGALCIMDPRLARYIDLSGLLARARACRASIHLSIRRQMGRCIYPSVSLSICLFADRWEDASIRLSLCLASAGAAVPLPRWLPTSMRVPPARRAGW
jgi:hypothetical protein